MTRSVHIPARRAVRCWLVLLFLAALAGSACARTDSTQPSIPAATSGAATPPPIRIVVSIPVFVSLVQAVGGQRVDVRSVVPPGADPLTYQPTDADVLDAANASLLFVNGGGLEPWLRSFIHDAGGTKLPIYTLSMNMQTVPGGQLLDDEDGTPSHTAVNPYLWLDPNNAVEYVRRIAQRLEQRDPVYAAYYEKNAERYIDQIKQLDAWAIDEFAQVPPSRRVLATFDDVAPYFAAHYGLNLAGVISNHPASMPVTSRLSAVAAAIEVLAPSTFLVSPDVSELNPELAGRLAVDAGIRTENFYSLTPPGGLDYLGMMRLNVENVVAGLGQGISSPPGSLR